MLFPLLTCFILLQPSAAATPYSQLWLSYLPVSPRFAAALPITSLSCGPAPPATPLARACEELLAGLASMLNRSIALAPPAAATLVVALPAGAPTAPAWPPSPALEAFSIAVGADNATTISAPSAHGALHGAWHLLRLVQREDATLLAPGAVAASAPAAPLRVWDLWDNLDGSVERGYAGPSIVYPLRQASPQRYTDFARLLSSVGLNAITWDNVNACGAGNEALLESANLALLAPLAAAFYSYGISSLLTPCWASPQAAGGLNSSDPADPAVEAWWRAKVGEAAALFGRRGGGGGEEGAFKGFLFKGDTEGQPGPGEYNLTELQGANFMGALLQPVGAICVWRAFSHPPGGKDMPLDQALYQFQRFRGWDGAALPNVVVQTKNGPFDFQVREPVHALFGALPRVSLILELEVTPEYLGQNKHLVGLPAQWATYLAFDLGSSSGNSSSSSGNSSSSSSSSSGSLGAGHGGGCAGGTTLAGVVAGGPRCNPYSGMAGVSNFGAAANWTGHILHAANAFGFGRLAWAPTAPPLGVLGEWAAVSFPGSAPGAADAVATLLAEGWTAYENFTASLGWGFVAGGDHYDMDPAMRTDYTNATKERVGYQRAAPGAYGAMYNGAAAAAFLSLDACPEELLLSFWNLPYTHRLRGARYGNLTVLGWIYASHAAGARAALGFASAWRALAGSLNLRAWAVGGLTQAAVAAEVAARLDEGARSAATFAGAVTAYFAQLTGVPPPLQ